MALKENGLLVDEIKVGLLLRQRRLYQNKIFQLNAQTSKFIVDEKQNRNLITWAWVNNAML